MEWWQAVILGIVEGLTEYLPVSSTGHLLLAQRAMGIPQSAAADAYAICIQSGAILAVLGLYRHRLKQMTQGLMGKNPRGFAMLVNIIVAFAVTGVLAVLLEKSVKAKLFNLPAITTAWLVGGLAILAVVYLRPRKSQGLLPDSRGIETLTLPGALLIGLMQTIAMWPGTSRSLITIFAGLLVGLSVPAAVEFSFLLGVVTLLAATAKDAHEHGPLMLETYSLGVMLLGVVVAAISAAGAVKWMVSYLRQHSLAIFGWYRIALAVIVGALMMLGLL